MSYTICLASVLDISSKLFNSIEINQFIDKLHSHQRIKYSTKIVIYQFNIELHRVKIEIEIEIWPVMLCFILSVDTQENARS